VNKFLLSIVSLALATSSVAVVQQANAQEQPASSPTAAAAAPSTLMIGRWSLDMAAGVAASDTIAEEDRARRIESMTGVSMTMLLTADGVYETSMEMDGNAFQRPGRWTIDSESESMVRLAFVADDRAADSDRPPDYLTLTFESADRGTCVFESDGYPVPMVRVAE
jgi:hypothetical protein